MDITLFAGWKKNCFPYHNFLAQCDKILYVKTKLNKLTTNMIV